MMQRLPLFLFYSSFALILCSFPWNQCQACGPGSSVHRLAETSAGSGVRVVPFAVPLEPVPGPKSGASGETYAQTLMRNEAFTRFVARNVRAVYCEAALACDPTFVPVDAAIVGIADEVYVP